MRYILFSLPFSADVALSIVFLSEAYITLFCRRRHNIDITLPHLWVTKQDQKVKVKYIKLQPQMFSLFDVKVMKVFGFVVVL